MRLLIIFNYLNKFLILFGLTIPFSVINPVMYFAGVTSKAGFLADEFLGAILILSNFPSENPYI